MNDEIDPLRELSDVKTSFESLVSQSKDMVTRLTQLSDGFTGGALGSDAELEHAVGRTTEAVEALETAHEGFLIVLHNAENRPFLTKQPKCPTCGRTRND